MSPEIKEGIRYLRKKDKVLAKIINKIGLCTLEPSKDYYKSLTKSIIYQQLAQNAARTIYTRFLSQLSNNLTPSKVLHLADEQFKRAGISSQKKSYLLDLSAKFKKKDINPQTIPELGDEEVIEYLTQIRGIGRWSAEMFLIFCLNRLNVLPLDDLGFQRAVRINYKLRNMPSKSKILSLSRKWGRYRSIAVWYLWQSINKQNGR
jgi:DNA-3-methyladenine glycosylase II